MPALNLTGCAPVPLAHYLKALGILRLVAESAHGDPAATACWQDDTFVLHSRFDRAGLTNFFLKDYAPTAVLAPWNGGGGFFFREGKSKEKDAATGKLKKTGVRDQETAATKTVTVISDSKCTRLKSLRSSIQSARNILSSMGLNEAPKEELKEELLTRLRNHISDEAIGWMDATVALGTNKVSYPPLLGTGGTDGNLDFTNNFMQRITEVMDVATGEPAPQSESWLHAALFAKAAPGLTTTAPIGQFSPAAAGGANATSGFDAPSAVNPWDFILMIEGALLFAAASVKKLESTDSGALVYPFCVRQTGVGYASATGADEADARCEMWLPLWERPTALVELRAIFGEGRAQVRGRPARNGVDFAQAAVTLGVDRGIAAFQRYGFLVRNGLAYFATPLERIAVRRNTRADLLADIEQWHDRLRQKAATTNSNAPASVTRALNQLERRILDLCRDGGSGTLLAVLAALGAAERALARSFKWTKENYLRPLSGLGPHWLDAADDGSPEFRLAASLASSRASFGKGKETLRFRQHLEPLKRNERGEFGYPAWSEKGAENDAVWHDGNLVSALNEALARRLMRFQQAGVPGWLDWSPRPAALDDISAFIEGRVNEDLLADLLWGLACLDWQKVSDQSVGECQRASETAAPSAFYALLKLCHHRLPKNEEPVPLVPAILRRAMNGDGTTASQLAARRLRASGRHPLVTELPVTGTSARRTAAAILFPISHRDHFLLIQTITHNNQQTI